jgi:hypothetical protein
MTSVASSYIKKINQCLRYSRLLATSILDLLVCLLSVKQLIIHKLCAVFLSQRLNELSHPRELDQPVYKYILNQLRVVSTANNDIRDGSHLALTDGGTAKSYAHRRNAKPEERGERCSA